MEKLTEKLNENYGRVTRIVKNLPEKDRETVLNILSWTNQQLLFANELASGLESEMIATMGKEKYYIWCKNLYHPNEEE